MKRKLVTFQCNSNPLLSALAILLLKKENPDLFDLGTIDLSEAQTALFDQIMEENGITIETTLTAVTSNRQTDYLIELDNDQAPANQSIAANMVLNWQITQPTDLDDIEGYADTISELKERIAGFVMINQPDLKPVPLTPTQFYKQLADDLRLKSILLIINQGELCVCELMAALEESQPKISRHLAQLRKAGVLLDRRKGQWVYYRLNPSLPEWMQHILNSTLDSNSVFIQHELHQLENMSSRPENATRCC